MNVETTVCQTARFESGPYMAIRLQAATPEEARELFDDLAEAAIQLTGRPRTAEDAAERTEVRVYPGFRRIAIGRLRIEVVTCQDSDCE